MIHVPGATNGGVNHTYGGQVDALPTLLHLLGIDSKKYLQLGQDLFSPEHKQVVAFRDGDFVTPQYTFYGGKMYDNQTAEVITEPTPEQEQTFVELNQDVDQQLITSDKITNGDLLRYYQDSGLDSINPSSFDYRDQKARLEEIERQKGAQSSSLYSENNQKSTVGLYKTKTYQQYE